MHKLVKQPHCCFGPDVTRLHKSLAPSHTCQGGAFLQLPLLFLLPLAAGQAVINFLFLTGRQNVRVLGPRRVPPAYVQDSRD